MTTDRMIENEANRTLLVRYIEQHKLPFCVSIVDGRKRSIEQNRLQRLLCNEIADQLGDRTPEEVRGECKLTLGVPILRAENDKFRVHYDTYVRPLPYAQKMALMMEPLDLPVTRIMTVKQKTDYLDAIYRHYSEQGLVLTVPDDLEHAA